MKKIIALLLFFTAITCFGGRSSSAVMPTISSVTMPML